jgi:hypothetical protein
MERRLGLGVAHGILGDDVEPATPGLRPAATTALIGSWTFASGIVAFMNDELRNGSQPQVVERIYWT